jgi:NADPH-dependent 2,4-dienoyl-CoA reductase/sulfur reductase-like enzyme
MDSLIARSPETFRDDYAIDARIRSEVTEVDLSARRVLVEDQDTGKQSHEGFDRLLIATGAAPVMPDIEGAESPGIFGVQTLDDGRLVQRALEKLSPKRGVIVGAGYIGLEMAEALKQRGLEVTIVERLEQPMNTLDPDMGAIVAEAITGIGVTLVTGETVQAFGSDDKGVRSVVTDGREVEADIVIMGLGVRPETRLAEAAGLRLGRSSAIAVDDHMATSAEEVWAAGDCAEKFHRVSGRKVHIALGTHANKEGRTVGINVTRGDATFPGVIGTAVSKICDVEVGRTGLKESETVELGFDATSVVVEATTRAGYYPGAAPIKVKLIAETPSGRVLGAQIVGKEGAAKRIDALATAIWNEMSVRDVINLDLSYAPPFSPLWDPVLIAARQAATKIQSSTAG